MQLGHSSGVSTKTATSTRQTCSFSVVFTLKILLCSHKFFASDIFFWSKKDEKRNLLIIYRMKKDPAKDNKPRTPNHGCVKLLFEGGRSITFQPFIKHSCLCRHLTAPKTHIESMLKPFPWNKDNVLGSFHLGSLTRAEHLTCSM